MSKNPIDKLLAIEELVNERFPERTDIARGFLVSLLTKNHMFMVGVPGTGKTALVNFFTSHIKGSQFFFWLMTKFTKPEEVFGVYSIADLQNGVYRRLTSKKLPTTHIAFLDEVFKASSGILNCLLQVMNERQFCDADMVYSVPLITMVGASNELPTESEELAALYDRFLLRYSIQPIVEKANLVKLCNSDLSVSNKDVIDFSDLCLAIAKFEKEPISIDLDSYIDLRIMLANEHGIVVSDRRFKQCISLLKASAYLAGRSSVETEDYEILINALWNDPSQISVISKTINNISNPMWQKAIELFDAANDAYKNFVAELNTQDNGRITSMGTEVNHKLKSAGKDLEKLIATVKSSGGTTAKIEKLLSDVKAYNKEVVTRAFDIKI